MQAVHAILRMLKTFLLVHSRVKLVRMFSNLLVFSKILTQQFLEIRIFPCKARYKLADVSNIRENTVFTHNGIRSFTYFTRVLPYKMAHPLYVVFGLFIGLIRVPNLIKF